MSDVMKPAGAWGWTTIGAKNPRNEEARKAAGETSKQQSKKDEKKDEKKKENLYKQS